MDAGERAAAGECGPWNPGIRSQPPRELLPLATVFRPANVSTSLETAEELRDFTGLELHELVTFRPERLVVHELLVRVTADIAVSDGSEYEALGINFRRLTATVLERYVTPEMARIAAAYEALRQRIAGVVDAALADALEAPRPPREPPAPGPLARLRRWLVGAPVAPGRAAPDPVARDLALLSRWQAGAEAADDYAAAAAFHALVRVARAVRARHGRLVGERGLLRSIVLGLACNEAGSELAGELLDPLLHAAIAGERLTTLPIQSRPVVMNTKGASAAGKSTLRPRQRRLADEIGARWDDFALISPDIWRKFLLDYDTLGAAGKYAGTFTGHELRIVDQKLDRYMARKAERRGMTHLLIDRFRFDSFAPASDERGSNLLTRFGHLIYMIFMITPPHETVERAWRRGLEVGRFKAVDDLLYHNVEAFTGMPELFFTWALRTDRRVHYEFLDNGVARGRRPRTAAFGWNGEMAILDMRRLLDVDRYRKIDVAATDPEAVYRRGRDRAPESNTAFVSQCARSVPGISLAAHDTGLVYARIESGRIAWVEPHGLDAAVTDADTRAGVLALAPDALDGGHATRTGPVPVSSLFAGAPCHTIGAWGGARADDDNPAAS